MLKGTSLIDEGLFSAPWIRKELNSRVSVRKEQMALLWGYSSSWYASNGVSVACMIGPD
jgi:hypothetical protein